MAVRIPIVIASCGAALMGAVALVAAPGVAWAGVLVAASVGALAGRWARSATAPGADAARIARRAGLIAGAAVTAAWLVLTGLVVVLGPATGAVLLVLVPVAVTVRLWRRRAGAGGANPLREAQDRLLRLARGPDPSWPSRAGTTPPQPTPPSVSRPALRPPPRSAPQPASQQPASQPALRSPADQSTPQLCVAWQRTYFMLRELPTGTTPAELVDLRGRLLDEFERRDPDGFTRWLATGARAASNPGRYLAEGR